MQCSLQPSSSLGLNLITQKEPKAIPQGKLYRKGHGWALNSKAGFPGLSKKIIVFQTWRVKRYLQSFESLKLLLWDSGMALSWIVPFLSLDLGYVFLSVCVFIVYPAVSVHLSLSSLCIPSGRVDISSVSFVTGTGNLSLFFISH